MEKLVIHLALHGVIVLAFGALAGIFLWRSIVNNTNKADWHLFHASVTSRGIMLIALAAIIHLPVLPSWQISLLAWFIIYFVWSSVLAMFIRAVSGEHGFAWAGPVTNRVVYVLYVSGAIVLFPGLLLLVTGLYRALVS